MAIFDDGDKIRRWKYVTKFFKFTFSNKKIIDIPVHQVKEINIEENYEEYYFPLIKVKLVLDSDTYYEILKNKNDCKINLRIDKFYFEGEKDKDPSISKKFINDTFELIMDDGMEDMYHSLKLDENKDDFKTKKKNIAEDLNQVINELSFYLFKPTISNTKTNVNKIFKNCNVTDAIVYLATVAKLNNILMAPPDNTTIYNEFLLPPQSILRSLEFIDLYYGLYKTGSMIYFGLDYTYILPYTGKCTVHHTGEIYVTTIIVPKSTNVGYKKILGSLRKRNDKSRNYIIADFSSLNIENQSISNNYLNANNIQAIDSYEEQSTEGISNAIVKNSGFKKIAENKTLNPYYASMYAAQSDSKSIIVSLRLQDFDISAITPNKEFNLIFEDSTYRKKYNGKYLIAGISHLLLSEGNHMGTSSVIVLRKLD